jgi:hypothetical protein
MASPKQNKSPKVPSRITTPDQVQAVLSPVSEDQFGNPHGLLDPGPIPVWSRTLADAFGKVLDFFSDPNTPLGMPEKTLDMKTQKIIDQKLNEGAEALKASYKVIKEKFPPPKTRTISQLDWNQVKTIWEQIKLQLRFITSKENKEGLMTGEEKDMLLQKWKKEANQEEG